MIMALTEENYKALESTKAVSLQPHQRVNIGRQLALQSLIMCPVDHTHPAAT